MIRRCLVGYCAFSLRSRNEKAAAPSPGMPAVLFRDALRGGKKIIKKYIWWPAIFTMSTALVKRRSRLGRCASCAQCFSRVWSNSETNKWCHHMYFSFFFYLWSWFDVHLNGGWKLWFIPLLVVFHFAERRGIPFERMSPMTALFFMGGSKEVSKKIISLRIASTVRWPKIMSQHVARQPMKFPYSPQCSLSLNFT